MQEVAIIDVRKEISFCRKVGMNVLGVVENMAGLQVRAPQLAFTYQPQGPGAAEAEDVTQQVQAALGALFPALGQLVAHVEVFPSAAGGAARMAGSMGVELLGRVPLDPAVSRACEAGQSLFEAAGAEGGAAGGGAGQHVPTALPALNSIVAKLVQKLGT